MFHVMYSVEFKYKFKNSKTLDKLYKREKYKIL